MGSQTLRKQRMVAHPDLIVQDLPDNRSDTGHTSGPRSRRMDGLALRTVSEVQAVAPTWRVIDEDHRVGTRSDGG